MDSLQRLSRIAHRHECYAEIAVRHGLAVRRGRLVTDNSVFTAPEGVRDQSHVVMEGRDPIVQSDRLADQVHCQVAAANLVGDDAKKMEAVEVILIDREDFPVVGFGFCQLAGLMMPLRRGQQLGNRTRGPTVAPGATGGAARSPSLAAIRRCFRFTVKEPI